MKRWKTRLPQTGRLLAVVAGFGLTVASTVAAEPTLVLDAELDAGYQEGTVVEAPGGTVSVELYGKDLVGAKGYSARISYDPAQITYRSFTPTSLIPGLLGITLRIDASTIEVGGGSLEGAAADSDGRLGVLTFSIDAELDGPSSIALGSASLLGENGSVSAVGASSISLGGGPEASLVLDASLRSGYQGARSVEKLEVGDEVTLELYGSSLTGVQGYSAALVFDASRLSLVDYDPGELIPGFTGLVDQEDAGTVQVGGLSLNGSAGAASGRLATVTFRILPGFGGAADIALQAGLLSRSDGTETIAGNTVVKLRGEGVALNPSDFDGSGRVDFADFLIFVGGFGKRAGQAGYEARFDFDGNARVDFADFLTFVQEFGKRS